MGYSKEDIKEIAWKWRCKVTLMGNSGEKTVSDFSSDDSLLEKESLKEDAAQPTTKLSYKPKSTAASSKEPGFGGVASIKTLYEGKNSTDSYIDWQDYPPRQISSSAAKVQDRVAIKLYKVKDKDKPVISGKFAFKYHRIDVQNPLLVAALEPIVKKEDVHLDVNETAIFNEPFRPLYFGFDDIVTKYKSLPEDDAVKPFLLLLIKLLDEIFAEVRVKRKQLGEKGLVTFKHAWTYFPKDSVVVSHGNNCDVLSKVIDTTYVKKTPCLSVLSVRCKVMRFNGEAYVWEEQALEIAPFDGIRPVTELRHYPLSFHKEADDMKERMIDRGKKMLDYQGLHYAMYHGIAIYQEGKNIEKHNVEGRILVDVMGFNKHHLQQGAREGKNPVAAQNVVAGRAVAIPEVAGKRIAAAVGEDGTSTSKRGMTDRLTEEEQQKNREKMLQSVDDLMFMSPLVEGYALKNKLWVSFYVEDIRPMEWNEAAYDHLVYDAQQKDLVLSFVENHGASTPHVQDVIVGKGKNRIFLQHLGRPC
jgi:hypothetical protein